MAKQKKVKVNGTEYTLQSVSPRWYYEHNDNCKMATNSRNTAEYVDGLLKNVVIEPKEVSNEGMDYFDRQDDISSVEKLTNEIESFLRGPAKH